MPVREAEKVLERKPLAGSRLSLPIAGLILVPSDASSHHIRKNRILKLLKAHGSASRVFLFQRVKILPDLYFPLQNIFINKTITHMGSPLRISL